MKRASGSAFNRRNTSFSPGEMKPDTGMAPCRAFAMILSISALCSSTVFLRVRRTGKRNGEAMSVRSPSASHCRVSSNTAWRMFARRMKRSGFRIFQSARPRTPRGAGPRIPRGAGPRIPRGGGGGEVVYPVDYIEVGGFVIIYYQEQVGVIGHYHEIGSSERGVFGVLCAPFGYYRFARRRERDCRIVVDARKRFFTPFGAERDEKEFFAENYTTPFSAKSSNGTGEAPPRDSL